MPTICKISLDASEYRQELQAVLAESKQAARTLSGTSAEQKISVTADTTRAEKAIAEIPQVPEQQFTVTGKSDLSDVSDLSDKIPALPPVSVEVVAETVKIAELKAKIAELEDKEIKTQVKVVDDQIALLQKELQEIQSKDVNVRTEADTKQVEKLQGVIAALQDKKVAIQTEVHSEQLDKLRGELKNTESGTAQAGRSFKNLLPKNIGEQLGKGASAISAIGTAAGIAVPSVGMLGAVVNALLSPVALITAALAALGALGMKVWDTLTVSAEEYAEKTKAASEEAQQQNEKIKAQSQSTQEYLTRLRELEVAESTGNAAKTETLQLLANLESQYGNLGAVIDSTSGKITNLAEVEKRANAARNAKRADSFEELGNSRMNEAKAAYMKVKGAEWFTTESGAGKEFDQMRESSTPEELLKFMQKRAAEATEQDQITGYNNVAAALRTAVEDLKKAENLRANGYESQEEYQAALANKAQQVTQAKTTNVQLDKSARRKQADNDLSFIRDSDAKIANRQGLIAEEKKQQSGIQKEIANAQQAVNTAGTREQRLDAEKRLLDAQAKYKRLQLSQPHPIIFRQSKRFARNFKPHSAISDRFSMMPTLSPGIPCMRRGWTSTRRIPTTRQFTSRCAPICG